MHACINKTCIYYRCQKVREQKVRRICIVLNDFISRRKKKKKIKGRLVRIEKLVNQILKNIQNRLCESKKKLTVRVDVITIDVEMLKIVKLLK